MKLTFLKCFLKPNSVFLIQDFPWSTAHSETMDYGFLFYKLFLFWFVPWHGHWIQHVHLRSLKIERKNWKIKENFSMLIWTASLWGPSFSPMPRRCWTHKTDLLMKFRKKPYPINNCNFFVLFWSLHWTLSSRHSLLHKFSFNRFWTVIREHISTAVFQNVYILHALFSGDACSMYK